jgi:hypothetical protein
MPLKTIPFFVTLLGTFSLFFNSRILGNYMYPPSAREENTLYFTSAVVNGNTKEPHDSETTIIINTSLIKTHPSLLMFNASFDSLRYLHGLPRKAPIVITIDGLMSEGHTHYHYEPNDTYENRQRLQDYVRNLRLKFKGDKHVTILHSYTSGLLTVNLRMAMDFVNTKYVLVVQHDLRFIHDVDYKAMVQSMEDNPEILNIIRFAHDKNSLHQNYLKLEHVEDKSFCNTIFRDKKNGLEYVPQAFSDQNHFTTKDYYLWMLDRLGPTPRFMETAMMKEGFDEVRNCRKFGQWLYGPEGSGPYIEHLDGYNKEEIAESDDDRYTVV